MQNPVTGLALGGIGGFNTHDAGVLKALYDSAIVPDIITCTSGAIFWTHEFLVRPEQIREEVERQVESVEGANALAVAFLGDPGIFAPAYRQYWTRWLTPWKTLSWKELFDRILPAQIYEPKRKPQDYAAMADVFNHSTVPIVFNAFAISRGRELLFCNPAAFDFLGVTAGSRSARRLEDEITTEYRPIDAGAVEAALWLVLYGLEHRYEGEIVVDGAYHRQLIISELSMCDVIYAVKPQSDAWHGAPPSNYFEVQNFNTEMWFNSSFAAEVASLRRTGRPDARIERITMDRPLGFFNFFVEKLENYTDGYEKAQKIFERDRDTMHPLIYPLYRETVPEPPGSNREAVNGAGSTDDVTGTRTSTRRGRATKPRPD